MIEVFFLALALSMDAFAVSIGLGMKKHKNIKVFALKVALFFGFFQALMPLLGYLGGLGLKDFIGESYTLISFALLVLIGVKMIYEAYNKDEDVETDTSNKLLLILACLTSIDALAAGFTLRLYEISIVLSLFVIGFTTFIFSFIAIYLGYKGGEKYASKAEILGGVILIIIGFKILLF